MSKEIPFKVSFIKNYAKYNILRDCSASADKTEQAGNKDKKLFYRRAKIKKGEIKMEIVLTDQNFKEEVLSSEVPTLVDFWAPWCGPCKMIGPAIEEIANQYQGKIKVGKLNVDDAPVTASKYSVMSIPTLMIFKGGEVVDKIIGVVPKEQIEEKLKAHI